MTVLTLLFGLVLLTGGAELLVRGASRLAVAAGISPLVVGLTVVAFGTSAPELLVSIQSTLEAQPDVALGNVLGSNIFNVLFILGVTAIIVPLRVSAQLIRFEVPLMIGISVLVLGLAIDGTLGRLDGAVLATGLFAYTVWLIAKSRREQAEIRSEFEAEFGETRVQATFGSSMLNLLLLIVGLSLLVWGANWFVESAITLARRFGVSELVIGLTIVAVGTSLPEVATSVMAAFRGERDIAVGNVVGSNLFNLMGVLGVTGMISSDGIGVDESALFLDFPVVIAVALACLPVFFTGHAIDRKEGGVFLAYYFVYVTYLVTASTSPVFARSFGMLVVAIALPVTVLVFLFGFIRGRRDRAAEEGNSHS